MTPDERDEMNRLCRLIQTETEPRKFNQRVRELDQLLSKKEDHLTEEHPHTTPREHDSL